MVEEKLKRNIILALIIVIAIILLIFIIRPGIIGYTIYKQVKESNYSVEDYGEDIQDLKTKLLVSDTNLSSCSAFNKELLTELEKYSDKFSECNSELNALKTNFSLLRADLDQKNEELDKLRNEKQEEIDYLELQYDLLAENLANNLCCKAKVDNPDISSYKIENNMIICLEEGGLDISCLK
ncbi:MAG: hypothetical protein KKA61_00520 [Nanoarchaeota archaeon]|nr:hypothetical protein [Nanoarchaeota archaeon]MBU4284078.1 hypothetical protein [Nanoarchaeota archaeon]MBU4492833.1 hypothetical protein [Nanoarchaeota archaeon]